MPSDSHLKTCGVSVVAQVEKLSLRIFHVIVVPSSESVAPSASVSAVIRSTEILSLHPDSRVGAPGLQRSPS